MRFYLVSKNKSRPKIAGGTPAVYPSGLAVGKFARGAAFDDDNPAR